MQKKEDVVWPFLKASLFFICGWALTIWYFLRIFFSKNLTPDSAHAFAALWAKKIVALVPSWNIKIQDVKNLPLEGPFIIVANHQSYADIWCLYHLPLTFRWLAKEELFRWPFLGKAMSLAGYIPVRRFSGEGRMQALKISETFLRDRGKLLFFPEGTRSYDGKLLPFKLGAFRLSIENDVPIVPIVLMGAHKIFPRGSLDPRPGTVTIKVLSQQKATNGENPLIFCQRVRQMIEKELIADSRLQ